MSTLRPDHQQQQRPEISLSTAQLTCLCGAVKEPGTLLRPSGPTKTFPVSSHLCHCDSCRYVTGNLAVSCPVLTGSPSPASLAHCTVYATSPQFVRYFCTTCGCHCFTQNVAIAQKGADHTIASLSSTSGGHEVGSGPSEDDEPEWYTNAGLIERDPAQVEANAAWASDLVGTTSHIFVGDTLDGGVVPRLSTLASKEIPLYTGGYVDEATTPATSLDSVLQLALRTSESNSNSKSKSTSTSTPTSPPRPGPGDNTETDLKAACHCGRIELSIRRPDYAVDTQGVPARYIVEGAKTKYPAYFCACRSDRTGSGAWFVQPWTYIPPANVRFVFAGADDLTVADAEILQHHHHHHPPGGPALRSDSSVGRVSTSATEAIAARLAQHRSSAAATRSFCRTCGATVFYMHDERPSVVNVAVGILRAQDGALARDWLAWAPGKVVCPEEATEQTLLMALMR